MSSLWRRPSQALEEIISEGACRQKKNHKGWFLFLKAVAIYKLQRSGVQKRLDIIKQEKLLAFNLTVSKVEQGK